MNKIWTTATAAFMLCSTPVFASGFTDDVSNLFSGSSHSSSQNSMTNDIQFGAGIGLVDMGLNDSGVLFYALAEKGLDLDLDYFGDVDSVVQLRMGTASNASSNSLLESSLDFMIAGSFKASLNISHNVSGYALLGLAYNSITVTTNIPNFGFGTGATVKASTSDFGLHYGIGAEYAINSNLKAAIEYVSYAGADGLSANVIFNF